MGLVAWAHGGQATGHRTDQAGQVDGVDEFRHRVRGGLVQLVQEAPRHVTTAGVGLTR
jgi:hypothetical protein